MKDQGGAGLEKTFRMAFERHSGDRSLIKSIAGRNPWDARFSFYPVFRKLAQPDLSRQYFFKTRRVP
ncbi:MAG TPA: hypothetical protein VFZ23_04345, partial [Pyrinomonadaceae bacterium]